MTSTFRTALSFALALALSLTLVGCDRQRPEGTPPAVRSAATPMAPASPAAPHIAATAPPTAPATGGDGVTGKILETMDSGGYTYLRLATGSGAQWAAVPQAKVAVGDTVTIANAMPMNNFESTTLHRTFDSILFGSLAGGAAGPGAPPNPHAAGGAGPSGSTGTPATSPVALAAPIARAAGPDGRNVAEVHAQKAALVNKAVAVRGRVTKYNGGIMGKNWLHLQDGSGTAGTSDFDLVVTTSATAAVGDVVVVRGAVHTDKDFGAGYVFAVIIEDATVETAGRL